MTKGEIEKYKYHRRAGWSLRRIGRKYHRHHSTIQYWLGYNVMRKQLYRNNKELDKFIDL